MHATDKTQEEATLQTESRAAFNTLVSRHPPGVRRRRHEPDHQRDRHVDHLRVARSVPDDHGRQHRVLLPPPADHLHADERCPPAPVHDEHEHLPGRSAVDLAGYEGCVGDRARLGDEHRRLLLLHGSGRAGVADDRRSRFRSPTRPASAPSASSSRSRPGAHSRRRSPRTTRWLSGRRTDVIRIRSRDEDGFAIVLAHRADHADHDHRASPCSSSRTARRRAAAATSRTRAPTRQPRPERTPTSPTSPRAPSSSTPTSPRARRRAPTASNVTHAEQQHVIRRRLDVRQDVDIQDRARERHRLVQHGQRLRLPDQGLSRRTPRSQACAQVITRST